MATAKKKTATEATTNIEKPKFEEAVARLEEVVRSLESENIPLDEMLILYEEGVGLVRGCLEVLDEAEQKVKMLARGEDGKIVPKDVDLQPDGEGS